MKTLLLRAVVLLACACTAGNVRAQARYTLRSALQTASTHNLVLKTEQYNVTSGQADITTARLRPNLQLNNQTLQMVRSSDFAENTSWNNTYNRQVWWQLTKPFQLPHQRKYKIDLAGANYNLLAINYAEAERDLFLDVATTWLDVWSIENRVGVIRIAQGNADTLARINEVRLRNQVISQTDLIRTQLLAEQYKVQLRSALQELKNRKNDLRLLLGLADSVTIDAAPPVLLNGIHDVDSLIAFAMNNRTDMQAARSAVQLSDTNIKLQRSMAMPQPELGVIWNPQNSVPYVGFFGTIELPLFSRNQGEIQRSTILRQQAEQHTVAIQNQIETEIRNAYAAFSTQQQNVQRYAGIIGQSQTILDNVRYAYLRGGTTIIDFLEAQRSWLETQQQYFDAQQQYQQSYIQLLYVSGLINQLAQ